MSYSCLLNWLVSEGDWPLLSRYLWAHWCHKKYNKESALRRSQLQHSKWHSLTFLIKLVLVTIYHYLSLKEVTQYWFGLFAILEIFSIWFCECESRVLPDPHSRHRNGQWSRCRRFPEWEMGWITTVLPPSVIDSGIWWPESTLFIFFIKKSLRMTL